MSHSGYFSRARSKGSKLGYYRASVACDRCRKRKARCMPSDGDPRRCASCVRLGYPCVVVKVEVMEALDALGEEGTPDKILKVQKLIGHVKDGAFADERRRRRESNPGPSLRSPPANGRSTVIQEATGDRQWSQLISGPALDTSMPCLDFPQDSLSATAPPTIGWSLPLKAQAATASLLGSDNLDTAFASQPFSTPSSHPLDTAIYETGTWHLKPSAPNHNVFQHHANPSLANSQSWSSFS